MIAERTGTDTSAVLLGLWAIALSRLGLLRPAVIRPLVNNRFRPALRDLTSNVVQTGVCVIDAADTTVDETVIRAQRLMRSVYKHAYFDPADELALLERLAEEQGDDAPVWGIDAWSYFNDRRARELIARDVDAMEPSADPLPEDAQIAPEQIRDLLPRTDFRWTAWKDNPYEPLFLHIDEVPAGIVLAINGDTRRVTPAQSEALVRAVEQIAVDAATDPALPTGVAGHGDNWAGPLTEQAPSRAAT